MSNRVRCSCQSCTCRGLMGPAIVITLGVLFLLHEMRGGYFDFGNTYPVILIVIGIVSLASALSSREGHISSRDTLPPAVPPMQGVPPAGSGSAPAGYQGQGQ